MARIITILLLLGLSYYTVFFLVKPKWDEINVLKAQAASYKETLDNIQKMRELRNSLVTQYNSVSDDEKKRLDKIFASSMNEGELMVMFDNIAKSSSVVLSDISFSPKNETQSSANQSSAANPYKTYGFNLEVNGSYNAFKEFLKNLEKSLVLSDIASITFDASSKDSSKSKSVASDIYKYSIKGVLYLKNK